jgi:hypothetical protein
MDEAMRTKHQQPIGQLSARLRDTARPWLRFISLAATLALFALNSADAGAEPIPSGRQRLTASDAAPGKTFGDAVAIDGDTAVIGAPLDSTQAANAGAVYVFIRVNNGWVPHPTTPKLLGSASAAGDQFGSSVAISGQSIVVGAVARNFDAGGAYVFHRATTAANSNWTEEQNITPTLSPQDQFGCSVAVLGTTVLVGAQGDTGNDGAAYVYVRGSATPPWAQQGGKLLPQTRVTSASFGVSVALGTDTAVVGAPGQTDAGSAFVFRRAGTTWGSGQALTLGAPLAPLSNGDSFGRSVAVSGTWLLVGAPGADVGGVLDAGAVFFFERSGSFVSRQRFDTPTPVDSGEFGRAVVMAGSRALVSAPQELSERGQVHLFSMSASGVWSRAATRLSSGLDEVAGFGRALAISSDAALVGASQEPCTVEECGAQGAVYAYGIIELAASVPLLPQRPLLVLGAGLGACGLVLARRRARLRHAQA